MIAAQVILPVPVPNTFTYLAREDQQEHIEVGRRVIVSFGKSKLHTGIVLEVIEEPEVTDHLKFIEEILDDHPIVTPVQLKLWEWIADYYMCTIGEVMVAALPSGLKLQSESRVLLRADVKINTDDLTDREYLVYEALQMQHILSIKEVSKIIGIKTVHPIIKKMITKNVIVIEEELQEAYKVKEEKFVQLNPGLVGESALNKAIDGLARTPAQMKLFMNFLSLTPLEEIHNFLISKSGLKKRFKFTPSIYSELVSKGLLVEVSEEVSRLKIEKTVSELSVLSEDQERSWNEIKTSFKSKAVTLFHGVTGSGKTEVYVRLIKEQLDQGKQVLYLLPEIALTTQLIQRLQKYFGKEVGMYHSRFNSNERVEVWNAVKETDSEKPQFNLLVGARSSIFLPFKDLGLIIVDEEHETSFKQFDPAPRYHARDSAIMLAHFHKAKTVLGSATPCVESYFNATHDRYGYVELDKRFGGIQLPVIFCADVQEEQRKKTIKGHFTSMLISEIEKTIERGQQIILFQNRRGFAPMLECQVCAHIPQCVRCDVSLTYHKHFNELRCHYCGYSQKIKITCEKCGSIDVKLKGFGTEKIEEEIKKLFPKLRVGRMDLDTTRKKDAYKNIITEFEEHNLDVLIGTQMVTKGLDFDNVGLVGIMNADNMLNWPDFRAHERAFHLMAQVSGRAGRKKKRGKVIIQTYNPHHNIVRNVIENDFKAMYQSEILQRKNFHYPPFYRIIELTIVHSNVDLVNAGAKILADQLMQVYGKKMILGPEFPPVARIRLKYHKNIILKIDRKISIIHAKKKLKYELDVFLSNEHFRSLRIISNVDPA